MNDESSDASRPPRWLPDALGLAWVFLSGLGIFVVAFHHGASIGPYDALSRFGLTKHAGVVVHNTQTGDQITEMVPWATLNWIQVHHGHLPLWNPYNALGLPLAFNWQSASFSLPAMISYLAPLHLAYTTEVLVTVFVAGGGAYVLGRVLRLSVVACTFAAVVFELGGAFTSLLGWPLASVVSWGGWILAAVIVIFRGGHRVRSIAALAVVVALAVYAGQPDVLTVLGAAVLLFVLLLAILRTPSLRGSGPILRPLCDVGIAVAAGAALAAPLLLPGLQLLGGSARGSRSSYAALPARDLVHLLTQGFDGLPTAGNTWPGVDYLNSSLFIGVIALVLIVVALRFRWRQPEVAALGVVGLALTAVAFLSPVASLIGSLPIVGHILWNFALLPLGLVLAILAGVGMDVVVRDWRARDVRSWALGGFAGAAVLLAALWLFSRGHLTPHELRLRSQSFVWPVVGTALGLAVVLVLGTVARHSSHSDADTRRWPGSVGRWAGIAFLVCETAFLLASSAPLWASSSAGFVASPAIRSLQKAVGTSVVGFGNRSCFVPPTVGILPEANIAFGIHQFDAYDPVLPERYFSSWFAATGQPAGVYVPPSAFCPAVTTASAARLYGIGFVLEPPFANGPVGGVFAQRVGNESLYRIPNASPATLVNPGTGGSLPPADAPGHAVQVTHRGPADWHLMTDSAQPQILRLRLTDVPGWRATIDGHSLALSRFNDVMLQARIPAGHHIVVLKYWPITFSIGVLLALATVIAFAVALRVGRDAEGSDNVIDDPPRPTL